jgi:hypothetical protein
MEYLKIVKCLLFLRRYLAICEEGDEVSHKVNKMAPTLYKQQDWERLELVVRQMKEKGKQSVENPMDGGFQSYTKIK